MPVMDLMIAVEVGLCRSMTEVGTATSRLLAWRKVILDGGILSLDQTSLKC